MTSRDVERGLTRKGWRRRDSHHVYYRYVTMSGRMTALRTKVSHGSRSRQLSRSLVARMARQCHLAADEFERLISCPLSQEAFEAKMKAEGVIRESAAGDSG